MEKNIPGFSFPIQIVTPVNPDGTTGAPTSLGTDLSRTVPSAAGGAQLAAANSTRRKIVMKNDSAIDMWFSLGTPTAPVVGPAVGMIRLPASGGYFELDGHAGPIFIIAASGTPPITAREW